MSCLFDSIFSDIYNFLNNFIDKINDFCTTNETINDQIGIKTLYTSSFNNIYDLYYQLILDKDILSPELSVGVFNFPNFFEINFQNKYYKHHKIIVSSVNNNLKPSNSLVINISLYHYQENTKNINSFICDTRDQYNDFLQTVKSIVFL